MVKLQSAVFIDRDGVLTDLVEHNGRMTAPWNLDEFKIKENAPEAVSWLKCLGYAVFVVTNQPDVYDNKLEFFDLKKMSNILQQKTGVDAVVCALDRNTEYYKPNCLTIDTLIHKYKIDRFGSYIIGDTWKDIVCGYSSGIKTIFLGDEYKCPDEYKSVQPDYMVSHILDACIIIEDNEDD